MDGLFDVIEPQAWGWQFDRARGQITLRRGEVRIANAELRLLAPPPPGNAQAAVSAGLLTGNFLYRTGDAQIMFDVTGAAVPLSGIERIQAPSLPTSVPLRLAEMTAICPSTCDSLSYSFITISCAASSP